MDGAAASLGSSRGTPQGAGGAGGCPQVLSGHSAELTTGPPVPMSSVAELRPSPREPGGNHKSGGYTRALSPAVFDRHQIQFPWEGPKSPAVTAPRLRQGPARSHPQDPLPSTHAGPCPRALHCAPQHSFEGGGVLLGTPICPPRLLYPRKLGAGSPVPAPPPWWLLCEGPGLWCEGQRGPKPAPELWGRDLRGAPKTQGAGHRQHWGNAPQITPQRPDPTPAHPGDSACTDRVPTGCQAACGRVSPPPGTEGTAPGLGTPRRHPGQEGGGRGAAGRAPAPARLRRSAEESR